MRRIAVAASVVAVVMLVVTIGTALALDCHGRLVVIGASPWEVKERCGEPTTIEDVMKHLAQRAHDPISQTTMYILVPVQQSIWTYNFGSTRFLYDLTFQEGKLIDVTTGDDGHLWGIDAPETPKGTKFPGQPYGPEAEAYLKRLVEGKRGTVEMYGVDQDKRLLATMFIDKKDINLAMIEVGLVEVYRGPESGNPYKVQYQAAEETARAAKKGMWVLGDKYESPRAYRKRVGIS